MSVDKGLISVIFLPSALFFSLTTIFLNTSYSTSAKQSLTLVKSSLSSSLSICSFSYSNFATTSSFTLSIAAYFSNLSLILIAWSKGSLAKEYISSLSSSVISRTSYSIFSWPTSLMIFSSNLINSFTASWPNINASNISSSVASLAPASTMFIASLVPATVKSISLASSSSTVGLIISFPSTLPTLTPAIGPSKGTLEIHVAKLEPTIAVNSGELSGSTDNTVFTTCTSFLKFSGNKGRIGLSIIRAASVALSVGLPSLLINPPGILPTEYNFSWYKTISGKKSDNTFAFLLTHTVDKTTVSPYLTRTAPWACFATSPISTVRVLPLNSVSNILFSIIHLLLYIKRHPKKSAYFYQIIIFLNLKT